MHTNRYEVTGSLAVSPPGSPATYAPGSFFEDDLDPAWEQRRIAGGHIRKLPRLAPDFSQSTAPSDELAAEPEGKEQ